MFVETFDSGDKIFYTYQATGKMKGIKGSGTCKTTGTADGGLEYTRTERLHSLTLAVFLAAVS